MPERSSCTSWALPDILLAFRNPNREASPLERRVGYAGCVALSLAVALTGCGHTPEPMFRTTRTGPVSMAQGSAESFVPLVAASAAVPRCEDLRHPPPELGARALSFIYGDPAERRVTVILDAEGEPTGYSDLRGDLVSSDDREGDLTSVTLNLVRRQAFASNRPASGEPLAIRMPFDEALSAASLDHPQELLERVLATCGGDGVRP